MKAITYPLISLAVIAGGHAATLLSTDFAGTSVSGSTLSGITWTTSGLSSDPGPTLATNGPDNLFDTTSAAEHFAPQVNIGNGATYTFNLAFTTGASSIELVDLNIAGTNLDGGGNYQINDRAIQFTVGLFEVGNATALDTIVLNTGSFNSRDQTGNYNDGRSQLVTGAFNGITLSGNTNYEFSVFVEEGAAEAGNNSGVKFFEVTAVPEPSIALLGALSMIGLLRRRR
jgi:hypothetical protein